MNEAGETFTVSLEQCCHATDEARFLKLIQNYFAL
jgi:hypothetical protein